jgi:hypothetical protein
MKFNNQIYKLFMMIEKSLRDERAYSLLIIISS